MSAATKSTDASHGILQVESPSNDNPVPISREHTPAPAESQHPEQRDGVDQSNEVTRLVATYGIKTQPRPRTLKRTRDMLEGHDDGEESDVEDPTVHRTWYIDSSGTGTRFPPSQGFNTREGGFAVPYSQRPVSPRPQSQAAPCPTTPHRPNRHAQTSSLSPLTVAENVVPFHASQQAESQETESWVDTPLVTPNGSSPSYPQLPAEEDVTLSQLGFPPEQSQPAQQSASSPAGTPSRRPVDPQLPPPAQFRHRTPSPAKSRHSSGSPSRRSPRSKGSGARQDQPPSPRYHLRQRAPGGVNANTNAHTNTNANTKAAAAGTGRRATSRSRTAHQGARKTENAAPPVKKKQKPSPPADPPGRMTRYGLRKNGDVEGIR
ncbi:hypothetical protein ONZ51_g8683 [Trametes cubensis]|uniref:Uncharacterized protein n=1 Tax=Trametes cubensis TaxID=1111947 RepID=A0AAD7TMT2_9APHY|nr:hypothetical protein ONZ51_g8683 [Trametes cubensis]